MGELATEPAILFSAAWRESSLLSKLLLTITAVAGCALFYWTGKTFDIPSGPMSAPSLLGSPHMLTNILVVISSVVLSAIIGTLIAGRVRFDAGLFTAAAGLLTLSLRGRSVGDALRTTDSTATSSTVFHGFAIELGVIYGILLVGWGVLWLLHAQGWLHRDAVNDELEDVDESLVSKLLAAGGNLVFCDLLMMLLTPTDAKAQVILGIGSAAFLAALVSHSLFPVRPSIWFWAAPLIVGTVAYLWAPHVSPEWRIGVVGTAGQVFGPYPARAMPLDFAGAGTMGTLLGYWLSRKFHRSNMLTDTDVEEET